MLTFVESVEKAGGRPVVGLPAQGREFGRLFFFRRMRKKKLGTEGASKMPPPFARISRYSWDSRGWAWERLMKGWQRDAQLLCRALPTCRPAELNGQRGRLVS